LGQRGLRKPIPSQLHGLTAQTVVLDNESPDQYEAELDQYLAHFQPQGKPEWDLVHQLAAAHWRLCRYAAVETAILDHQMERDREWLDQHHPEVLDHQRLAIAFERSCGANSALALLNRYDARLHREYRETLKLLEKMQAARDARLSKLQNKPKAAEPPLADHAADNPTPPAVPDPGLPWVNKPNPPPPLVQPAAQPETKLCDISALQPLECDLPSRCETGYP